MGIVEIYTPYCMNRMHIIDLTKALDIRVYIRSTFVSLSIVLSKHIHQYLSEV